MTLLEQTSSKFFASLASDIDCTVSESGHFPMTLWRTLADKGLLRHYQIDPDQTGHTNYTEIAAAGLALTKLSASPGLTMTWLGQLLKLRILARHAVPTMLEQASNFQSKDCIGAILRGDALCSLAISEPGAGAHPKRLSARATRQEDHYILNGEKAYVSHGPYADWFIVLAITDIISGKKQFSAFLVHKQHPGLTIGAAQSGTQLAPSSHCQLTFDHCKLASEALIGTPGLAFEEVSKPMRTLEDALMLAPVAGAIQVQLGILADAMKNPDAEDIDTIDIDTLGRCLCLSEALIELSLRCAERLDQDSEQADLTTLIIGARTLISEIQANIQAWLHCDPRLGALHQDIELLGHIGQSATQIRTRSVAKQFLSEKNSHNTRPIKASATSIN